MDINSYIKQHKSTWSELEQLLEHFKKKRKRISSDDIDRLTYLYKKASTNFAFVQTHFPDDPLVTYLNHLVSRTHHIVYKEQFKSKHQLSAFFKEYFQVLIHKRRWFIVFAFLLFLAGAVSGAVAVAVNPLNLYILLPPEWSESIDPHRVGEGHDGISHALFSTMIMTNNIQVAIFAFIGGITFGLWTTYLLFYNGLIVGALAAVFWQAGQSYVFWAYILPHGMIELTVIFIAGGAGLYMGYRMLVPGPYPRKYQILQAAKESAQLLLGTIPLFVIAGMIEGYITPSHLSLEAKYGVGMLTFVLLLCYFFYGMARHRYKASLDLTSR